MRSEQSREQIQESVQGDACEAAGVRESSPCESIEQHPAVRRLSYLRYFGAAAMAEQARAHESTLH